MMSPRNLRCIKSLSNVEYAGSIAVIVTCLASLTAILTALAIVACRAIRNRYYRDGGQGRQIRRKIFATHLDVYAVLLLLESAVEAVGGILSIQWLRVDIDDSDTKHYSRICGIQGALEAFSIPGVQMYTLAIAVHTFLVIVAQWKPPKSFRLPIAVVFSTLLYRATLFAIVALASKQRDTPPGHSIFEPTPLWCTISDEYRWFRVTMVYIWVGANTVVSNVLYVALFLYIRGNIVMDPDSIWRMRVRRAPPPTVRLGNECSMSCLSLKMLAYPIFNLVLSVPFWSMRLLTTGTTESLGPWYFVCVIPHYAEGLGIVLLLHFTRPTLLGRDARCNCRTSGDTDSSGLKFAERDPGSDQRIEMESR